MSAIQNCRRGSAPSVGEKARVRAPTSAPRPMDAIRKPNPCAPTRSTWSAKSGIKVSRFIAKREKTATATRSIPTTGSRRAYAAPCTHASEPLLLVVLGQDCRQIAHQQQRADGGKVADGVGQEANWNADRADDQAGDR